jgi:hypothetical protein
VGRSGRWDAREEPSRNSCCNATKTFGSWTWHRTAANENTGAFSIDGEWVAYDSDLSGRHEVYLTRADGTGTPIQVSVGGGEAPRFGRNGTTLYYRQHRMVFRVGFREGRPLGKAIAVFEAPNVGIGTSYDINADETRMIAVQVDEDAIPRVITNFFDVIRDGMGESASQ